MLRQLGWGQDYPAPLSRRRGIGRLRWRLLAVTSLAVVVVGFLAGLTGTRGGLVALGLAVVLVGLLGAHHAGGGRRWLARAVAEYAVVAVLVALLAAHYGPHAPPAAKQPARPRPAAAAPARPRTAPCPAPAQVRAWITCIWHAAMDPPPRPTHHNPAASMSHPGLDPDLAAALEVLAELGPLQVLDAHPTPPERWPAPASAPAAAGPTQPSLFDREPAPAPPATTDPYSHLPPSRRWREVPRHAGPPLSPTTPTRRNSL